MRAHIVDSSCLTVDYLGEFDLRRTVLDDLPGSMPVYAEKELIAVFKLSPTLHDVLTDQVETPSIHWQATLLKVFFLPYHYLLHFHPTARSEPRYLTQPCRALGASKPSPRLQMFDCDCTSVKINIAYLDAQHFRDAVAKMRKQSNK